MFGPCFYILFLQNKGQGKFTGHNVDGFTLKPVGPKANPKTLIAGVVSDFDRDNIYMKITIGMDEFIPIRCDTLFDINFHGNRQSFQTQHNALELMKKHDIFDILISDKQFTDTITVTSSAYKFSCKNSQNLNTAQKRAVQSIVEAHNCPIPFLLFGPPGTGKTKTIVAAIEELVSKGKFILVCAQSNTACDEIANRAINVLGPGKVYRMYAKSFSIEMIGQNIRKNCNVYQDKIKFPSLEYLSQFPLVVCTLQIAGCIARAREKDPHFNSSHFSHIIIDEAACVHETVSMIPIAGYLIFFPFHFFSNVAILLLLPISIPKSIFFINS